MSVRKLRLQSNRLAKLRFGSAGIPQLDQQGTEFVVQLCSRGVLSGGAAHFVKSWPLVSREIQGVGQRSTRLRIVRRQTNSLAGLANGSAAVSTADQAVGKVNVCLSELRF